MIDQSHSSQPPADWPLLSDGDQRLRVLVADHDGLARRMMRTALSDEGRVAIVLAARDGCEALELARLVMRAADGQAIVPQRLIMPLLELVQAIPDVGWRPLQSRLTTREWEIVELLGERASTARIAEQFVLSHTTVYSHIKNIMRKLDVRSRHDAFGAAEHLRRQEVIGNRPPFAIRSTSLACSPASSP